MFAPIRFLWNATRGHRLMPWRSPYFRWRMETYSGMRAEEMTLSDIAGFMWAWKGEFVKFLFWTGRVQKDARRRP